jgi:hypothetical protein
MMKKVTLFIIALLMIKTAHAQTVVDSIGKPSSDTVKRSPLKTMSYKQYDALLKGKDLYNMAAAAELNHYPMPDKVMKFKKQLDLSPVQISKITLLNNNLQRKKLEMGPIIIRNERRIDSLFKTRNLNDGIIIFYSNRYGLYQGEIRNAILQACFATEKVLSTGQIRYLELLENQK